MIFAQVQAAVSSVLDPLERFRKEQIGEAKVMVVSLNFPANLPFRFNL